MTATCLFLKKTVFVARRLNIKQTCEPVQNNKVLWMNVDVGNPMPGMDPIVHAGQQRHRQYGHRWVLRLGPDSDSGA
jgi:hypothetical protein